MSRSSRLLRPVVALLLALTVATGCSPLSVGPVDPATFYVEQTRNSLSYKGVSEITRITMRRYDLLERWEKQPEACLAELHDAYVQRPGGDDELFALAELSLRLASNRNSRKHYLAAAVYAYAFLFPQSATPPDPFDWRLRIACDIYNRAVAEAFSQGEHVVLQAGTYELPFGTIELAFDETSLVWHRHTLVELTPVGRLRVKGLRNRYRTPGIGAPLSARPQPPQGTGDGADSDDGNLIGPNARVPMTALLRIDWPRVQLRSAALRGSLELYSSSDVEATLIDDRQVTLEAEPTAVLGTTLAAARPWEQEIAGFLGKVLNVSTKPSLLRAMHPYQRGKIPVVFVHGTASSAFRWADMFNDLTAVEAIRDRYQFWFFGYDSGNPIAYSAYRLRKALVEQVGILDPERADPALRQMVVIGHSQGGLLTKMTAIDSGDAFWRQLSDEPFEETRISAKHRQMVHDALFVIPLPFVRRLIFIATPHRGSYLAGPQMVRRLFERLVHIPADVVELGAEVAQLRSSKSSLLSLERIPTSIDNMSPGNPFIQTLSEIPVVPDVKTHSIIPCRAKVDFENGNDGVVEYSSAHIEGVESELVVHGGHSTQSNPHTIAEVQRILLEHARLQ